MPQFRVLPDITGITLNPISNGTKTPVRISQADILYNINGVPSFIFGKYSGGDSSSLILQLFPDGSWNLVQNVLPVGISTANQSSNYLINNTIVGVRDTTIGYAQLSFSPFDGGITGSMAMPREPSIPKWCLGDNNRGYNLFPISLDPAGKNVYGTAWSSGEASGVEGAMMQGIKPQKGDLAAVSWMAKTNNGYLSDFNGISQNWWTASQSPSKHGAIPMGNNRVAWTYGPYRGSTHRLVIAEISIAESYNAGNCNYNTLRYAANILYDINFSDYYAGINYGPAAIFPINDYVFSCIITNSSAQLEYLLVDTANMTIQRAKSGGGWTAGGYVLGDGSMYFFRVGDNTSGYNNVDIWLASKKFDMVPPPFDIPAFVPPPTPIRASDIRTLYRSK